MRTRQWRHHPFPEDPAGKIVDYAKETGQEAAVALIDKIRDWLGHPEVVMERAEIWDPEVKSIINDSDDSLVTARADLEAYWEGPAFDSFKVYGAVMILPILSIVGWCSSSLRGSHVV